MANILIVATMLTLSSSLVQTSQGTSGSCPVSWTKHGRLCYKRMKEQRTYMEARCECEKHGAIVATLSTPAKTDFINTLVNGTMDNYVVGADRLRGDWFVWMDDVPLDNTTFVWAQYQPDNFGNKENCLAYMIDTTMWGAPEPFDRHSGVDVACEFAGAYICEKPATEKSSARIWEKQTEGVIYPDNAISEHPLSSELLCGGQCMRNCLCHSFSYNTLNRRCILYEAYYRRLTGSTVSEENSVLYD